MVYLLNMVIFHFASHNQMVILRFPSVKVRRLQVPNAMIPVESFLRGLGVLVQRNFPVYLAMASMEGPRAHGGSGQGCNVLNLYRIIIRLVGGFGTWLDYDFPYIGNNE